MSYHERVHRTFLVALAVSACSLTLAGAGASRGQPSTAGFAGMLDEHPAIQYAQRPTTDRVAMLARAVADGRVTLTRSGPGEYLQSVLEALDISPDSQILVFSKTGVQRISTGPRNPRALYFNDSVVVGYIPGAPLLELAAHDPEQGVIFYTIDQNPGGGGEPIRGMNCLICHVSASTLEVPGLINRSVFPGPDGRVIPQLGGNDVNHRTPLLQRWGGMYVTGRYFVEPYNGRKHHAGNVTIVDADAGTTSNEEFLAWRASQPERRGYSSTESDIVSMMLFDHQAHAVNLLTRLNWEARTDGAWRDVAHELVDYFLFVGEEPPPAPLVARPAFAEHFARGAVKDRQGRSLRDLDLEERLLRYPCSYMIYTPAFDHLPVRARQAVYARMWEVLSGQDTSPKYAHLSPEIRRAIIEILRDTKRDLPARFGDLTAY
jgi:hypothetical protein